MSGWDRDANQDRDVLERIVALLFAFAGLADLAAGLPALRRGRVLAILGCGEAVARAFLTGMPEGLSAAADAPSEPGDASRLAARFRALALILAALLARAALLSPPRAAAPHAGARQPVGQARRQVTSPAPDTS